jgi:syntaxin-binding protein 5
MKSKILISYFKLIIIKVKFVPSKNRATAMHLPFKSSWLYIGTEKGNTYLLNIYNNFSQSGYDIKWNNVIEL